MSDLQESILNSLGICRFVFFFTYFDKITSTLMSSWAKNTCRPLLELLIMVEGAVWPRDPEGRSGPSRVLYIKTPGRKPEVRPVNPVLEPGLDEAPVRSVRQLQSA